MLIVTQAGDEVTDEEVVRSVAAAAQELRESNWI
jgi:hypothetical protein